MAEELGAFSVATCNRILQSLPGVSAVPMAQAIPGSEQSDGWVLAYTTGGVTARSGTTLGTGTAALKWINPSGVIQDRSVTVTVRNWSGTSVAANRYIWLNRVGMHWIVVNVECVT